MISGCILCEDLNAELTEEHIFPLNAGGGLHARILCKDCNSILGSYVDGPYLRQKHIELARMTYKIKGRARAIPQPLSGVHEVQGNRGPMRIRLNAAGKAIVVGSAPSLRPVEDGLELTVHIDATERENLPVIIRSTLERHFRSQEGLAKGWTLEQKENAIRNAIAGAEATPTETDHTPFNVRGTWSLCLKAVFTEHVKVLYEVACLEFGKAFFHSEEGKKLRTFLREQCRPDADFDLESVALELRVVPILSDEIVALLDHLTDSSRYATHLVIAVRGGLVCSMFGSGAILSLDSFALDDDDSKVYFNKVNGRCRVMPFPELIHEANSRTRECLSSELSASSQEISRR
ncbi:MAG: hypothetical protein IV101_14535 [Dechloromonas sp.]|uniref:HNH endonuclease n=1 Tax=Dechloromonas sp. TaxID=1917218 RepID=UPI0027E7AEE1|nr:HNH endonuclease [Dechloromonas sp.]MBT9522095.1 hypothetical protein [Dechloromonas sp.]